MDAFVNIRFDNAYSPFNFLSKFLWVNTQMDAGFIGDPLEPIVSPQLGAISLQGDTESIGGQRHQ